MIAAIPETVAVQDVTEWSDEVDVLVIGFGMGGGCAAVSAAEAGARVLALERAASAGGTTAMAGGHFYLGGGTAVQKATGHADSADEMYKYLMAVSPDPDPEKIRLYCDGSVDHFNWLDQAVPAPRGHKVPKPGDTGGAGMVVDLLARRADELGVPIRYETGATALILDEEGAVVGATWKRFAETGAIRAKSVIIAAGGFVMNPAMVAEYTPKLAEKPFVLGSTYDDGLGIRLGVSAGAGTRNMNQIFVTAPVYPPSGLLTGIIVNKNGERFVAEDSYHSRTSGFVMDQPDSAAYLIVDSEHMDRPTLPLTPFIDGWETVAEMEAALGIPAGNLEKTLQRYNEHAARGEDPDFHKYPKYLAAQGTGPWGAFDLTLGKAIYAGFTLGGLRTDADGRVLAESGEPISGLYAAGASASNIAQDGKGYSSGTRLGEASFFGRRAGSHASAGVSTG
jgi:succinate dehydrogenase/fumarate reductase flavoprotein subunit